MYAALFFVLYIHFDFIICLRVGQLL